MTKLFRLLGVCIALLMCAPMIAEARVKRSFKKSRSVVSAGLQLRGVRYRWGGTTRRGMDCSGMTWYLFRHVKGVRLPRRASQQARVGKRVAPRSLVAGDLVFFRTKRGRIGHVGLYVGNGRFLHSPRTGRRICVEPLSGYWRRRLVTARRVG